ncbi:CPBP family intramembrane metalloprotease [Rhodobacteraceae bacterium B1Z28]|uniref:CPBP family intramembrane metalloprotease n=1 Tax=Ruegeria haliotis TaxID=2747601 RepID=A0ABX2PW47_9RHOB|nr:CPBP family glutamic-type intramembrane protease [Ruegeria haliotis]NVO57875.1 CPBP family intramembrane metalloprotease [Ruegeria haliotis]
MPQFLSFLPEIWSWLILITAQVAALARRSALSVALLAVFASVSLVIGLISPLAMAMIGFGLLGARCLPRLSGWAAGVGHVALILWCLALGAHLVPGFNNLQILDQVQAGARSADFTMFLNVDKPMIFFAVLLAWPGMLNNTRATSFPTLIPGLAILPLLFAVGLGAGAIRLEVGLPPWWLVFALSNLFMTCLAEEAFFRGYLQSAITSRVGAAAGIVAASLLFGLAHFSGGFALVVFASILGLGCGLGYFATGRLWVSVAMHFSFNFLHLALFTYPGPV